MSTLRRAHSDDDDEGFEVPQDTARARTTSLSLNDEGSNAPSARMPYSHNIASAPSQNYQQVRANGDENTLGAPRGASGTERASTGAGRIASTGSSAQQGFPRMASSRTSSLYTPTGYNDEQQAGRSGRASTRPPKASSRYSSANGNGSVKSPAMTRSNSSQFTESDQFLEAPKESFNSEASSRRVSYQGSVRFSEFARGFSPLPASNQMMSDYDIDLQSIPGTPVQPWLEHDRSQSPVASSYYLPNSGRASPATSSIFLPHEENLTPVRPSMASMASNGYRSHNSLARLFPDTPSDFWDREWVKQGYIAKIHRRDDKDEWPNWKRYIYYTVPFLAIATLATYWTYFILRIICVIAAQRAEGRTFPMAWIFIGIEISVSVPTFLQLFWSIFILKKRKRPKLRLVGNDVPTVDVFITCCGEEVDLVMDTARAACDLDYPQDRFRVVILDDANSADLREATETMNMTYPNLAYRSRPKYPGVPHHFKAGNLNYGLEVVHDMPGGASRFIAALDADMIPEQHWLRAIMPHMLEDDKMALACPPQLFYNVPPGDPLCQSLDFFVHVSEPIKDALGVAWCTGSGYIVRRDALEEIGYFPQGSLAEDVATSTLLLGRGWKCAYIHEPLQFGTVPDSFGSHLKQRTRWAIGTVDTSFKLKFCLWGAEIKKLTFYQRMSSFIYAVLSLYNIFITMSLFALPIVLITGNALVAYATDYQLKWLIRACFVALFTNRLCELAMFLPSGYATGQRGSRAQIWMAPYITLSILRSFVLPTWLGGQKQAFKPSGSLKSELNERDPHTRAGVFQRLSVIAINYMAGYHMFYVYLVLAAVTLTTSRCVFDQYTADEKLKCLLTHAFWPPIAWIVTISAFWTPIQYALDPPSVPEREQLLDRDPKTGIAHPSKRSKTTAFAGQTVWFELEYLFSTAFTAVVFVLTFTTGIA